MPGGEMKVRITMVMLVTSLLLATGQVSGAVVTIDNVDPEVTFTGTWPTSTFSTERIGANYQHSNKVHDRIPGPEDRQRPVEQPRYLQLRGRNRGFRANLLDGFQ